MGTSLEVKYCCGCGLCSHFVRGGLDEKGYYRPNESEFPGKFDVRYCYCNQLNACAQNGLWGKMQAAYFGYSTDESIRRQASSGGILTTVAGYLLATQLVDYVIQVAPSVGNPMETQVVFSETLEDVKKCCGSRYTASASLTGLLDKVESDKRYAVLGKPCDIRVLRAYLADHKELQKNILYLLSFFCGGTPSRQANEKLLQVMGLDKEHLKSFTYRGNGWPGKTTGYEENGKVAEAEYEESWGNVLGRDLQNVCRFCWEGTGEAADISSGDGWYLQNDAPSFEERPGRNIIFANSEIGDALLRKMQEAGAVALEPVGDLNVMKNMQPGQYMRKGAMFARILAMRVMRKSVPPYKMFRILPYAKHLSLFLNIRMFGGTVKRIMRGKIK